MACYAAISTIYLLFYATQVLGISPMWAAVGDPTASNAKHLSFTTQLDALRGNRPFVFATGAFLLVNVGDAVFAGSLVYYVTGVLHWSARVVGTWSGCRRGTLL